MKTTIELPDDLLADAKAAAARRRTTLKAVIEHALRREIYATDTAEDFRSAFAIDEHGLPVFKKAGDRVVTSEDIYAIAEELGD